jgi:hypothetical protein
MQQSHDFNRIDINGSFCELKLKISHSLVVISRDTALITKD